MNKILGLLLCVCLLPMCAALGENELFTQEMVEKSLVAIGNTQRLHRAIDKAKAGEEVTLAYIGGSITEGAAAQPRQTNCYAALSAKEFAEKYMPDPEKLHYVNAGIAGTPSLLGVTRLEKDVLSKKPDIVFVEFAVNDGSDNINQQAYESLLRSLLKSETEPAVILIFTVMNDGRSMQGYMQQIGAHYDLGMISVRDAIYPYIRNKTLKWSDYAADSVHPNTDGHRLMADLIAYYFEQAEKVPPQAWQLPEETKVGNLLENLENIVPDHPFIQSQGDFPYRNVYCYSYIKGWSHRQFNNGNEPFVLKMDARRMTLVYQQQNDQNWGSAEVWVDGELKITLHGYSKDAWGNPVTQFLHLGEGIHDVEIKMVQGDEMKSFNLLDIGYVK